MKWVLTKASSPGWQKSFETQAEALAALRPFICKGCIDDTNGFDHELLGTPCGCEFWLDEEDDDYAIYDDIGLVV